MTGGKALFINFVVALVFCLFRAGYVWRLRKHEADFVQEVIPLVLRGDWNRIRELAEVHPESIFISGTFAVVKMHNRIRTPKEKLRDIFLDQINKQSNRMQLLSFLAFVMCTVPLLSLAAPGIETQWWNFIPAALAMLLFLFAEIKAVGIRRYHRINGERMLEKLQLFDELNASHYQAPPWEASDRVKTAPGQIINLQPERAPTEVKIERFTDNPYESEPEPPNVKAKPPNPKPS